MELEDSLEEERKQLQNTVENLEGNVKLLELKGRNAHDHSLFFESLVTILF